jgi:type III restriction enzyme
VEFKDYQQGVLDTFDAFLDELVAQRAKAEKIKQANALETDPDLVRPAPDFPKKAWDALKADGRLPAVRQEYDYSPRADGTGEPVPNVCLKIPTGGGKTLLAAAAVSRIMGRYLESNTGFVLWIMPNEAIYTQTKRQLTNREHPYRQMLDRAAAGRVKILEKNDRLDKRDVDTHLCVMLLMLQSANRKSKEMLRIFRDRGNVQGFFPPADDLLAHHRLLHSIPNLTAYADQHREQLGSITQDSLGNVMRFIRPVVVMDEGHKGYTPSALNTLYGFNPCFLLELSATPKVNANWLVDVRGKELADEEMIKLPINVKVKSGDDWRDCLRESLELTSKLQAAADALNANTARYVRPIMLVQVERTGKEQREAGKIHAEDAREFLLAAGNSSPRRPAVPSKRRQSSTPSTRRAS